MKQVIRDLCFETNSSSYHSLTIRKIMYDIPKKEIEVGKDLIIDNSKITHEKFPSWSESYKCTARGSYDKAQLVLRFLGYDLENQLEDLVDDSEYKNADGNWDRDRRDSLLESKFYETTFIKAFVKAIKRYIGEDRNVVIEFNEDWVPYIEIVSDEAKDFYELFDISEEDAQDVDKLADKFFNIIFNPEIEMIEECESNE